MADLDLHPRISTALRRAKIFEHGRILSMSAPDLIRATKLSPADVKLLHKTVAQAVYTSPPVTGLQILSNEVAEHFNPQKLSSGCKIIDQFLKGGFITKGITEISGESACGKTQLCMQLCLTVQMPPDKGGLGGGALYICTEDVFPNKRLMQMLHFFKQKHASIGIDCSKFSDNIFIEHAADLDGLSFCVNKRISMLLKHGSVKLVIIDSVAALFRCEYTSTIHQTVQRSKQMSAFAAQLHKLNNRYHVPIICVNQVTASMNPNNQDGSSVIPALGLTWANMVTSRFMLKRSAYMVEVEQRNSRGEALGKIQSVVRSAEVVFAPHLPNACVQFYIDQEGVKGLE